MTRSDEKAQHVRVELGFGFGLIAEVEPAFNEAAFCEELIANRWYSLLRDG